MLERELKFYVPSRRRVGLKAQLRKLGAEPIALHARYYDTGKQVLAQAGIALRVRREGESWVQTMKLPGPDELSRIEWNHPRPEPTLDLTVYQDTHIADLMTEVADSLTCRYITQVVRYKKVVPTTTGQAELAYDEGVITAGGIQLPVNELEIEHITGLPADFFELGRTWLKRHELILELRSKAARGDALAALAGEPIHEGLHTIGMPAPKKDAKRERIAPLSAVHTQRLAAPVRARQPVLAADAIIGAAYLECANECMNHIIRNSSFLAGVDGMKTSHEQRIEYVHQIRVGIRRLRACWKLFGKAAAQPAELETELVHYFRTLGQARDLDVIETELLPRLIHAGMPPDTTQAMSEARDESPLRAKQVASPEYQSCLLDLLEHLVVYAEAMADRPRLQKPAAALLCRRLNEWLDEIRRLTPKFLESGWDDRHHVRKRVKRLRYGLEFSQGVLDTSRVNSLRSALVSAQKSLGQLNDLYVAAEYYRGAGAKHPSAMFALGWLAATQTHEAEASFLALSRLAKAGRFRPASKKGRP